MAHKILLVLSRLQPQAEELAYRFHGMDAELTGRQTNEAPVKALLLLAWKNGGRVDEIIYLASVETRTKAVTLSAAAGKSCTAEKYLAAAVRDFCAVQGKPAPRMTPVNYSESDQADNALGYCLDAVIRRLDTGDTVDVDTTGGTRDSVTLLMLAVQLLQYKQLSIGQVVYSRLQGDRGIFSRKETYRLMDLIKAVEAFTTYGKADALAAYFAVRPVCNPAISDLCAKLKAFSDGIAICRTHNMDAVVQDIHKAMQAVQETSLPEKAEPAELLLQTLVPTMRAQFIRCESGPNSSTYTILQTIVWCADRGLIMPALALCREHYATAIFSLGLLTPTAEQRFVLELLHPEKKAEGYQKTASVSLELIRKKVHLLGPIMVYNTGTKDYEPATFLSKWRGNPLPPEVQAHPTQYIQPAEYTLHAEPAVLDYLIALDGYVTAMRNGIMHAAPVGGKQNFELACNLYGWPSAEKEPTAAGLGRVVGQGVRKLVEVAKTLPPHQTPPARKPVMLQWQGIQLPPVDQCISNYPYADRAAIEIYAKMSTAVLRYYGQMKAGELRGRIEKTAMYGAEGKTMRDRAQRGNVKLSDIYKVLYPTVFRTEKDNICIADQSAVEKVRKREIRGRA